MQNRVRIYYDNDNVVGGVEWFHKGVMETDEDKLGHHKIDQLKDHSVKIVDKAELSEPHDYAAHLYVDGDSLKVDHGKKRGLMPAEYIKIKHLKALNEKLDELLETDANPLDVVRLHRELDKCKSEKSDGFWYKQAEKNLDKMVSKGGADKPAIRKNLAKKIKDLG